ncbi:MAG: murein biosynthesis integral membrane protein MurJ [Capsulimonadales bacterium]|nr:murein biosynthesis integral membrane protein MurJ [Capsulimonadales bacterium]
MSTQSLAPSPSAASATARAAGRNTLMMMGFVLLSRILGIVRDLVISRLFGQNDVTDIYTAAFRVPDILALLVAGGTMASVFVPIFAEYWKDDDPEAQRESWHIFSSVITIVSLLAALLVVVMEFLNLPLTRLLNPLMNEASVRETARLSAILLPAQWCFFVGGLIMGTLNARHRFLIPAIGPVVYNGGIILGGLLLHRQMGIASMTVGAVVGAFAGNFLLPLLELLRTGTRYRPIFDIRHPGVRTFGKNMLPALIGLSLSQFIFWITPTFLTNDGSISALRNAYNMTQAPIGIFAQAAAIVLFPTISVLAARKRWEEFRNEVSFGIRRILFLTVPASVLMAVLAQPLFLLYSGDRFGANEVEVAAAALWCYSLATFAWSAQAVLARGFYAMQDTRTPLIITTSMVAVFYGLCYLTIHVFHQDYRGIAAATSLISTLNMAIFLIVLQKKAGGLNLRGMFDSAWRITLAAGLAGAVAYVVSLPVLARLPHNALGGLVTLAVAGGAGLALYIVLCFALRVPELKTIREMFRRKPAKETA